MDDPPPPDVADDLVSYHVVVLPDGARLAQLGPGLVDVVQGDAVRLLDLVLVAKDQVGQASVTELANLQALSGVAAEAPSVGGLLTEHDLELVSLALEPGTTALVLVTEDRWAEPLSLAARRVGGRIAAGERISPSRMRGVLHPGPTDTRGA